MKKGFTLIELLGVIAILGVIIAVAIPSLVESNKQAKTNEKKDFENTLILATKDYINYYGDDSICDGDETCINEANDLAKLYTEDGKTKEISTKTLIDKSFLKSSLVDPSTNNKLANEVIIITVINENNTLKYEFDRR